IFCDSKGESNGVPYRRGSTVHPLYCTVFYFQHIQRFAERYIKDAFGVEFVAFVSSVGKIHIPRFPEESLTIGQSAQGTDPLGEDGEEPLSEEFRKLLSTVTREAVDQNLMWCPHAEAAKKMEERSPATISQEQRTASYAGEDGILTTRGRHDPCVVPRAVPIVEAMAALVIIDAVLAQDGRVASSARLRLG
ncbi:hypothetical protein CF328_g8915, partial [Tilletia controversa]